MEFFAETFEILYTHTHWMQFALFLTFLLLLELFFYLEEIINRGKAIDFEITLGTNE